MTIDLRKMRQVLEVARAESITSAAGILAMSQPALTRRIAEVEEELGVQLFQRLPRGIRVTDVGREFAEHARKLLEDADEMLQRVNDHRKMRVGRVRVGIGNAVYQRFVASALADFIGTYPDLQLAVVTGSVEQLAPRVIAGEIDILLGAEGPMRRWPELQSEWIADLYCGFMTRLDHPILTLTEPCEADLLRYPIVLPETVEAMYTDLSLIYQRNGLPPMRPHYITDDFELVKQIVLRTDAFSPVLGRRPGFSQLGEGFHVATALIDMPVQSIGMATAKTQEVVSPITELIDTVTACFSESSQLEEK